MLSFKDLSGRAVRSVSMARPRSNPCKFLTLALTNLWFWESTFTNFYKTLAYFFKKKKRHGRAVETDTCIHTHSHSMLPYVGNMIISNWAVNTKKHFSLV